MATPGDGIFVGRQREMDQLKTALEDALSGQGRLVMLAGEPGIGKTRLGFTGSLATGLAGLLVAIVFLGCGPQPLVQLQCGRGDSLDLELDVLRSGLGGAGLRSHLEDRLVSLLLQQVAQRLGVLLVDVLLPDLVRDPVEAPSDRV
jgi:hypothetical protein